MDEAQVIERLAKPSGLLEGCFDIADEPLVLEPWQSYLVDTDDEHVILSKTRQGGFSLVCGMRARSRCQLMPANSYTAIFTSYNLEDALEKIRYVNILDDSFPGEFRRKKGGDSKKSIEYVNGNRIVTMFRPRGKGPAEVFLDEMAHMQDAREIYRGAVGATSRGGRIFIGSTPLAQAGMFHDIFTRANGKFGEYVRLALPWWKSEVLCVDVIEAKKRKAERMPTTERVERFATERIKKIFDSMFEEDFQAEYECAWLNESTAFLSWELIVSCSPTGDKSVDRCDSVDALRFLPGELFVGMDVGRRINATEITVGEKMPNNAMERRLQLMLKNKDFDEQEAVVDKLCGFGNVKMFVIDENGLGMQLAENAVKKWGSKVVAQKLSPTSKPVIANNMRMMMEKGLFKFYPDRETRQQFYSVKKKVTAAGNVVYDVDRNEKHHADKFWSAALMLYGASEAVRGERPFIRIVNFDDIEEDEVLLEAIGSRGVS